MPVEATICWPTGIKKLTAPRVFAFMQSAPLPPTFPTIHVHAKQPKQAITQWELARQQLRLPAAPAPGPGLAVATDAATSTQSAKIATLQPVARGGHLSISLSRSHAEAICISNLPASLSAGCRWRCHLLVLLLNKPCMLFVPVPACRSLVSAQLPG